jgi:hypothetical protein
LLFKQSPKEVREVEAPKTIDDILKVASEYLHEEKNINLIRKAYDIAMEKHQGQMRRSGEPYVQHPLEVAYLLATLHTGPSTIAAGLVHDVLEDTDMAKEEMAERLGKDVADIVDGVTKISKLKYMTMERALARKSYWQWPKTSGWCWSNLSTVCIICGHWNTSPRINAKRLPRKRWTYTLLWPTVWGCIG